MTAILTDHTAPAASPLTLVAQDMHEVDKVIERRLTSSVPLVAQISQYIIAAGGKRLRPALLLLMCGALDYREWCEKNPGQPMPAQEAAKRFSVPDGLKVTVFASEPLVRNPIAATFAPDGKLWVAENYTYAERELRFDPGQRDRVLVLTDTDEDGQADQSEVFLDNLQRLSSLEVGLGGVWLLCPPRLLFVPNQDGDSKPDGPARVVLVRIPKAQILIHL